MLLLVIYISCIYKQEDPGQVAGSQQLDFASDGYDGFYRIVTVRSKRPRSKWAILEEPVIAPGRGQQGITPASGADGSKIVNDVPSTPQAPATQADPNLNSTIPLDTPSLQQSPDVMDGNKTDNHTAPGSGPNGTEPANNTSQDAGPATKPEQPIDTTQGPEPAAGSSQPEAPKQQDQAPAPTADATSGSSSQVFGFCPQCSHSTPHQTC